MSFNMNNSMFMRSTMLGIPQQIKSSDFNDESVKFTFQMEKGIEGQESDKNDKHKQSAGVSYQQFSKQTITDSKNKQLAQESRPRVLIDMVNQINARFQNMLRSMPEPAKIQEPRVQHAQFISTMKKLVDLEIKQHVKGCSTYSKSSLRTILNTIDPSRKNPKKLEEQNGAYNFINVSRAANTMNFIQEDYIPLTGGGQII